MLSLHRVGTAPGWGRGTADSAYFVTADPGHTSTLNGEHAYGVCGFTAVETRVREVPIRSEATSVSGYLHPVLPTMPGRHLVKPCFHTWDRMPSLFT